MTSFHEWFEAQHGRRELSEHNMDDHQLGMQAESARELYERMSAELERRREWDRRKNSALWAWQAAGRGEEGGEAKNDV